MISPFFFKRIRYSIIRTRKNALSTGHEVKIVPATDKINADLPITDSPSSSFAQRSLLKF